MPAAWHRLFFGVRQPRCHVWHRFLTPCLASKRLYIPILQSVAQLRHLRLQMYRSGPAMVCRLCQSMPGWKKSHAHDRLPMDLLLSKIVSSNTRDLSRSLKCQIWAIDYRQTVWKLFEAKHGFKKRCQTWHRVVPTLNDTMPCLASFFDAMFGVKKLM